jgi:hypothetical protein
VSPHFRGRHAQDLRYRVGVGGGERSNAGPVSEIQCVGYALVTLAEGEALVYFCVPFLQRAARRRRWRSYLHFCASTYVFPPPNPNISILNFFVKTSILFSEKASRGEELLPSIYGLRQTREFFQQQLSCFRRLSGEWFKV